MSAKPPPSEVGLGTPFAGQIAHLRRKLNLPTEWWDDIQRGAHDRAFIVAGAAKADLLQDLHTAVERAVAGDGLAAFRKNFKVLVHKHGWTGWTGEGSAAGEAWRTRVIYQTNMATSYAAGRWRQLTDPGFVKLMPYWRYRHADGVLHPRPQHLAWHGLTLPHDHPFWKTHFAPNGWGCSCKVFAVAAPEPGAPTVPPAGWDKINLATGAPVGIDKGFDYAPGANADTPLRQMVQDKLITYPPAIATALSRDVTRYINATERASDFARRVLADPAAQEALWLGFVENDRAVGALLGQEVKGHLLLLPADAPRHVVKHHEHDGGTQRPAGPDDYDRLAEVLNAADSLRAGAPSRNGNPTLVASKKFGAEVLRAVFELLPGKHNRALALQSLVVKVGR